MAQPTSFVPLTNSHRTTLDLRRGANLAALVVLAVVVASCTDAAVTQTTALNQPPTTSAPTTSEPTTSAPTTTDPEVPDQASDSQTVAEEPDLHTSIGTLHWTSVTGDADAVPLGVIEATSDGELVVFEREFVWRSSDGLDWSRDVNDELEGLPRLRLGGPCESKKTGPFENHICESVGGRWQELHLPAPHLPEIPGLVWHVESSQPVESADTTLIPWRSVATVAWEDVYGLFDVCGQPDPCTISPFPSFNPGRDIWTVVAPESGQLLAELTMQITGPTIVFSDVTTGEEVHRIVAESPDQAEFIAEQMKLPYSAYVEGLFHTGAWVRQSERSFDLQPVPWSRPPRSVVGLPSGGFVAYQNTQRDGYTPGDSRVWTSPDGLSWVDHGQPAFLTQDNQRFFVDIHGSELRAKVRGRVLYTSCDGLVWTRFDVPPEADVAACRHTTDADFGTVATERSAGDPSWRFWISVDGNSWQEVAGPPGPHRTAGAGFSEAGATQDFLWLVFGDDGGTRTVWIGRFD